MKIPRVQNCRQRAKPGEQRFFKKSDNYKLDLLLKKNEMKARSIGEHTKRKESKGMLTESFDVVISKASLHQGKIPRSIPARHSIA